MRRHVPVIFLAVGILAGLATISAVLAEEKENVENPKPAAEKSEPAARQTSAYLGIGVEALSPALISQLPGKLEGGKGVIVSRVVEGSPAAKAGLKTFDIVTQYDNQKVLSPEQFVKLVRHDQPGRVAKLQIIRAGTPKEIEIPLDKRIAEAEMQKHSSARGPLGRLFFRSPLQEEDEIQWTSFDSLNLTRVDDQHFKAEITYKNDKGEVETHQYEGTLDEIRADVENCRDLPKYEQAHLLRVIDSPNYPLFDIPFMEMMPQTSVMWDQE